ncbi:maestro heat-like repeat-containing protein family member 1 [Leucoraja erinacea]|uniref:maestro heat-like repeat-containing protein family member 1 n=1 Tax=Leucoraja erinaceus TaxID=7782 RepID=UPI00245710C1|nr:maestro heat-like repeat-containing protein family member 1 [Leucoraja erinacea]
MDPFSSFTVTGWSILFHLLFSKKSMIEDMNFGEAVLSINVPSVTEVVAQICNFDHLHQEPGGAVYSAISTAGSLSRIDGSVDFAIQNKRLGHHQQKWELLEDGLPLALLGSTQSDAQGTVVFEIITRIIKDTLDKISQATAEKVITLAMLWMTMSGAEVEIQEVTSNVLAAMSFRFINEIVQLMIENFKQGQRSHMYLVKTLTKMSTENVYGIMPFLKAILNTMIPVLVKVREDEMKSAFASAMGSFSKSILIYLGNSEKDEDLTITRKSFSGEITIIYNLLFQVWLEKEPSKFNIPTVEALGYISNLLPKDKLEEELPKLILGILTLYEEQVGHFSITECLCRVLEIATEIRFARLKIMMDNLLNSLHQQICLSVDLNKQLPTRNQIAILSCFTVLASTYTDSVFNFLLGKLENSDQRMRAGTLNVLRHLISSSSSHLEGQKTQIMAAIKPVILDTSSNMEKKHVAQGGSRGAAALRLLQALSFSIHPAIVSDWEEQLLSLTDYLLENSEVSLPQQEWEEKLLLFLSRTLNAIDDEEWTSTLSDEMCKQIDTNHCGPQEKAFFYKSLGTVLHQMPSKNIKKELHQMLQSVQHSESAERESVAIAFGLCAMTHFDDTLGSLEEFVQSSRFKNMNSFFNMPRDKPVENGDKAKSTLVLCYGNMALYAPEELALSRIETHILPAVINQFNPCRQGIKPESKDLTLKLSLIKTVTLIARSLLSSHQMVPFNFSRKGELLRFMKQLIEAEPPDLLHSPVRKLAIKACTYLVQLHTESTPPDTSRLVQTCLMSTFSLVPTELERSEDIDGNTKEPSTLFGQTMTALQELLKQILLQDLSSEGLQAIFIELENWIVSRKDHERERAMATTLELLKYYLEAFYVNNVSPPKNLGCLIGQLMPRCADPSVIVGQMAMESLYIILTIQLLYESANLEQHNEDLEVLKAIKGQLINHNSSIFFQTCCQITEIISNCLPHDQLANLVFALFKGLADQHPSCSSAAALLMKAIIERRGSELWDQVSEIFNVLRVPLQHVPYKMVKLSVLRSIAILALHNTAIVVSYLLTYNITSDEYISDIWRSLAKERHCALLTMTELLHTLNKQLSTGERKPCSTTERPPQPSALESLAPVCALYEMMSTPESEETVIDLFPQLFSTLLVHHCSFVHVCLPKNFVPHHDSKQREFSAEPETSTSRDVCVNCVEMLIKLLDQSNNPQVVHFMVENGGWDQMMDLRKSHRGVMLLAKAMVQCAIPGLPVIVAQLAAFILTVQDCQKVTVAAFFGEVLKSPLAVQMQLTDILMNRLLRCLLNTSAVVQFLCVRGLGNITSGAPYGIEKYSRPVLCAMTSLMITGENDNEVLMFETGSPERANGGAAGAPRAAQRSRRSRWESETVAVARERLEEPEEQVGGSEPEARARLLEQAHPGPRQRAAA